MFFLIRRMVRYFQNRKQQKPQDPQSSQGY
jgi:hypothetical protein